MISVREGFDIVPWMKRTAEPGYEKRVTGDGKGYIEYHSDEPHIHGGSMEINPYAKVVQDLYNDQTNRISFGFCQENSSGCSLSFSYLHFFQKRLRTKRIEDAALAAFGHDLGCLLGC